MAFTAIGLSLSSTIGCCRERPTTCTQKTLHDAPASLGIATDAGLGFAALIIGALGLYMILSLPGNMAWPLVVAGGGYVVLSSLMASLGFILLGIISHCSNKSEI